MQDDINVQACSQYEDIAEIPIALFRKRNSFMVDLF